MSATTESLAAQLRRTYWETTDPQRDPWEEASEQSRRDWRRVAREAQIVLKVDLGDDERVTDAIADVDA